MEAVQTLEPLVVGGRKRGHEGITTRHQRSCPSRQGGACLCFPAYQAQVWSPRDRKTIRKTFPTVAQARRWRQESQVALRAGALRAPSPFTLEQAVSEWIDAAERGIARTRSGDPYKPSAIRSYRQGLNKNILPTLGRHKLSAIDQHTLQDLADELAGQGLSPSTIRNALMPLRALYRRATARGLVAANPTSKLTLPAVRGRRD